jgi:putative hydrolase of the HAD superfamily
MTKVVFFDAGGTLFRPYPSVGAVYARVAGQHGVHVDPEQIEKAFHQHWHSRNGLSTLAGLSSEKIERDWWHALVRDVFSTPMPSSPRKRGSSGVGGKVSGFPLTARGNDRMPFKDFDGFFQELYDLFARAECWRLFDDTIPVLKEVQKAGYRLGIISNWDHRLFSIVEQLGLSHYFEHVTASSKVGVAKPGKRIFEAALKAMNALPEESLHIGDSLEDDYHGASRAGLQAVLLSRHKKAYNDAVVVHTLTDLLTLLNGHHHTRKAQS